MSQVYLPSLSLFSDNSYLDELMTFFKNFYRDNIFNSEFFPSLYNNHHDHNEMNVYDDDFDAIKNHNDFYFAVYFFHINDVNRASQYFSRLDNLDFLFDLSVKTGKYDVLLEIYDIQEIHDFLKQKNKQHVSDISDLIYYIYIFEEELVEEISQKMRELYFEEYYSV